MHFTGKLACLLIASAVLASPAGGQTEPNELAPLVLGDAQSGKTFDVTVGRPVHLRLSHPEEGGPWYWAVGNQTGGALSCQDTGQVVPATKISPKPTFLLQCASEQVGEGEMHAECRSREPNVPSVRYQFRVRVFPPRPAGEVQTAADGKYDFGPWRYEYRIADAGGEKECRTGTLTWKGQPMRYPANGERICTPWGLMRYFGQPDPKRRESGWLTEHAGGQPLKLTGGRMLDAPDAPMPPVAPPPIDLTRNGDYRWGLWVYRYRVSNAGQPGERRNGSLMYGKSSHYYVPIVEEPPSLARMDTPWGMMQFYSGALAEGNAGWLTGRTFGRGIRTKRGERLPMPEAAENVMHLRRNADRVRIGVQVVGAKQKDGSEYGAFVLRTDRPSDPNAAPPVIEITAMEARRAVDEIEFWGVMPQFRRADANKPLPADKPAAVVTLWPGPGDCLLVWDMGWEPNTTGRLRSLPSVLPPGPPQQAAQRFAGQLGPMHGVWVKQQQANKED